jgi:competence protein ComEA
MNDFYNNIRERLHDRLSDLHFSTQQRRALLGVFLVTCIISVGVVTRGQPEQIIETAPIVVVPPPLVVDVAGGVKRPGVYSLPAEARVMDAIKAAGGAEQGMDMSEINLARMLRDGEQIYVEPLVLTGTYKSTGSPRIAKRHRGPININRATSKELEALTGIGPVLAQRIVSYRKVNGPFILLEDLQKVSGIGTSTFAKIKSKIKV